MQIYIAGICHFDPLCRARLETWLRGLLASHSTQPSFVAVEWAEEIFNQVKSQRPGLRSRAISNWKSSTTAYLDVLEASLAFEADTHNAIFPNCQTIWLDQGRDLPYSDALKEYASERLKIYATYIPPATKNFDGDLLNIMSEKAWAESDKDRKGATDRDEKFAKIIIEHLSADTGAWAVVIVGINHARRDIDRMLYRLEAAGFVCEVAELRPHL